MSGTALVIAAHGSHVEPGVNVQVRAMADAVAARGGFDEVVAAFNHGHPRYREVLDRTRADQVVVVPLMTSDGYFSRVVLPGELAKCRGYADVQLRITRPVGTHPGMIALAVDRAQRLMQSRALDSERTTLVLVGHGTERHATSGSSTIAVADAARRLGVCAEVLSAFLDEDPLVETIVERARGESIIVLPFLIARGPHVIRDLPRRLGVSEHGHTSMNGAARRVVVDDPIGTDPGIVNLIASLAREAAFSPAAHA